MELLFGADEDFRDVMNGPAWWSLTLGLKIGGGVRCQVAFVGLSFEADDDGGRDLMKDRTVIDAYRDRP